jgi:putative redox protein
MIMAKIYVRSINGALTQEVLAGSENEHRLLSDEPLNAGGQNAGPTPYDLLLAALGSCTSMTLLMYARRKNWALTGVQVVLTHDRIHADDCADCENETGYIDHIYREITLEGKLDGTQRQKLLDIAAHCPVHKTLTRELKIRDSLVSPEEPSQKNQAGDAA